MLHRRPAQLSGGQRQRVALGRALVRNAAVFLMDEPLSNLDALLRVNTRTEIKRLQRELGKTTIFVTHDQEEAMVLSDKIAIMRDGDLQQFGPPWRCTAAGEPLRGRVHRQSGHGFLDGELAWQDGRLRFRTGQRTIDLPGESLSDDGGVSGPVRSREAALGIRPTDLLVGAEKS